MSKYSYHELHVLYLSVINHVLQMLIECIESLVSLTLK